MIFEITATIEDLIAAQRDRLTDMTCELLRAHRMGHHFLIVPREPSGWLLDNLDFNERERATLQKIRNDYTQSASLRGKALARIVIDVGHKSGATRDGKSIIVGLADISGYSLVEQTQLLVEDTESDGRLYEKILDQLKERIGAPAVRYDLRNGGGQNIYNVWKQQIEAKKIVCLLADSDRKHHTDVEKTEVAGARKLAEQLEWLFAWAVVLPCREIENLVPAFVLEELPFAYDKAAQICALKKIEEVEIDGGIAPPQRFSFFYDMKYGLGNAPLHERYKEHVADWIESKLQHGGTRPCYNGFGSDVISYLLEQSRALQAFLRHIKSDNWWEIFGEVFALILWLGFAPRRQAT